MTETAERVLNGRYRISSLIGRGGMADVYLGHDLSLDRKVAVKMLRPDLARDPQFQGRFRREGQSSASLNHPNIVAVYDSGREEVEDQSHHEVKTPYIVMEYVDGVTLRHILHGTPRIIDTADVDDEATRVAAGSDSPPPPPGAGQEEDVLSLGDTGRMHAGEDHLPAQQVGSQLQYKIDHALNKPLSEHETAGYMDGILGALGYSHEKGIVHRDIKPSNVMVSQTGQIKVMDFGIARALADSASTMTQTSAVVGTAQYLSPEQARGEVVDHRSDLYSAGCVLFELLANRPPFQGESPVSVAYQHVREAAPAVSDFNPRVSPAMESVVEKALTKDPARRFQTAEEFNQAIQKALIGIGVDDDDHPTAALGAVGGRQDFNQVLAAGAAPLDTRLSARTPEDPDLYQRDPEPARRPRRRRGGLILVWTLLVLALVGGGAYVVMNMLDSSEVSIPDVEGLDREEAVGEIEDAGLSYSEETEPHPDIEEDRAIRTDPESGSTVPADSTVILYLSSGPESVRVPDGLQGSSEDEVRDALEEVGLEVGEVSEENDPEVEADMLISTDPEAGSSVSPGSEVDLVLSTGLVEMPGVFNRSRAEAQAVLEDLGLSVTTVEDERSDYSAGTVVGQRVNGQSVRAGDGIPQGSQVTLVVAVAPEAEPDPEPAPDEDDEDSADDDAGSDGGTSGEDADSDDGGGDAAEDGSEGNGNTNGGNSSNGGNGGQNEDSSDQDNNSDQSSSNNNSGNGGGNSGNGGGASDDE
ncbi:protein kinase domain-containing protein [Nesterenkonia lutea]|uniref:non-specific serine/threonine protein kinase n=1 Tax=Nesterenkonia lutea TaxID=272919 RepID=A0ABR9JI55_9MICC|nr:PASTA domain-containing protein [Nesterenkonia lutea]MBE1525192.1 serine/threonine-protein kinase [Nesterenkonia lutea]